MTPILALALALAAPPPTCVAPDGTTITLELAISDEERAQGLMYRDQLPDGRGMLFLFQRDDYYPFWMKNTFITLDIVWLSGAGEVLEVRRGAVPCRVEPCPSYVPSMRARAVLELPAGAAERHGIRPGTTLAFANVPGFPVAGGRP